MENLEMSNHSNKQFIKPFQLLHPAERTPRGDELSDIDQALASREDTQPQKIVLPGQAGHNDVTLPNIPASQDREV